MGASSGPETPLDSGVLLLVVWAAQPPYGALGTGVQVTGSVTRDQHHAPDQVRVGSEFTETQSLVSKFPNRKAKREIGWITQLDQQTNKQTTPPQQKT